MIDDQRLLDELQSLARQKVEAVATLRRIEGAEQMVRHLLGKLHESPAGVGGPGANGAVAEPTSAD